MSTIKILKTATFCKILESNKEVLTMSRKEDYQTLCAYNMHNGDVVIMMKSSESPLE